MNLIIFRLVTISVLFLLVSVHVSSAVFGSYENNQKPYIERLSFLYASAVDKRDFEKLREVFHDEAILEGPGFTFNGIEEIISGMEAIRQFDKTQHFVMNQNLKIKNMEASNEIYTIAYHFYRKEGVPYRLDWGIIYSDSLKREKGKWKILKRNLELIWKKDAKI